MKNTSKRLAWVIVKRSFAPLFLFLLLLGVQVFYAIKIASLIPIQLQQNLKKFSATVFVICIAIIIQRIADEIIDWYKENIAVKTSAHIDEELIPFLHRSLKIVIWTVAILVILPFYGVNISALIAVFGVSSLAISLAAQDTIANIIAGFLIMVDRPFRIGDKIKLPSGEKVKVLDVGIRRSKFLSEDKAIIIVPNLNLSKSTIVNYTYAEEDNPAA